MQKLALVAALLIALALAAGCKSTPSGNREFIPGKGWVPV
jgi:hypothetical protein